MLGCLTARARAWLRQQAHDEYRREKYARWADIDSTGWLFLAVATSFVLACKRPESTGLLLLVGCQVLLGLVIRQLIQRRRQVYTANRELFVVLGYTPVVLLLTRQQSINGLLRRHGGSPLRLLGLLLLSHPGTWTLVGALYGGLVCAANQLILPAIALSTVWSGNRSMCQQLLQVPEVEQPLGWLHWAVDFMHTGLLLPHIFSGAARPQEPMKQCLALNAWLVGALAVLLPLFIQSRLEAAARRRFYARRQHASAQDGEGGQQSARWMGDQPMEWTALYFASFLVWCLADVMYLVPGSFLFSFP